MAAVTVGLPVSPFQFKHRRMLKVGLLPSHGLNLMAGLTVHAESGFGMVGVAGQHKIVYMATVTVHGCSGKFYLCLASMAGFTVGNGVRSHQGESFFGM